MISTIAREGKANKGISSPRETEEAARERRAIGARLRARREYLEISRTEMGSILGVTEKGYGHYETGHAEIMPSKLSKVAERLGVSVAYFFGEDARGGTGPEDIDQEDRDTLRFLHGMPPQVRQSARAAIRAMHDASAEAVHGRETD